MPRLKSFNDLGRINGGVATGGSNSSVADSTKNFEVNMFAGAIASVTIDNVNYLRTIISNTADTLTLAPLPGNAATATFSGDNDPPDSGGTVKVTCTTPSAASNSYTIEVVEAVYVAEAIATSATFLNDVLTVTLGVDASGNPQQRDATSVAGVIDELEEFSAVVTEAGDIDPLVEPVAFSGGTDPTVVSAGDSYEIKTRDTVDTVNALTTLEGKIDALNDKIDGIISGATPANVIVVT
jgi:hypothetical protein